MPAGTTALTRTQWNQRWSLNVPLHVEYYGYLRRRTHEAMQRLFDGARAYARSAHGRDLPMSFNLNNIDRQAVAFTDLPDTLELELSYAAGDGYGCRARGAPSAPLPAPRQTGWWCIW